MKKVADIVASKGLDVAAWEDGVYGNEAPNPRGDFASRSDIKITTTLEALYNMFLFII